MTRQLYELHGRDDRRFSPFCWRARLALAHKGLEVESIPIGFGGKDKIAFSGQDRVPVLVDGDTTVSDSWAIACYLEDSYPDAPKLFSETAGRGACHFINQWTDLIMQLALVRMIVCDQMDHILPADKPYFRENREQRFGGVLEEVQEGREQRVEDFRTGLAPLRTMLGDQAFIAGQSPGYADYIAFSPFQFARCMSQFPLLEEDDPIYVWRQRIFGLFDGLAGNAIGYSC